MLRLATLLSCVVAPASAMVLNGGAVAQQTSRAGAASMKLSPEERRKFKLVDSCNWKPRTLPIAGKGYFFFQGPTPKTAVQEDLPSFFSAANFADLEFTPAQLGEIGRAHV